MMQLELLPSRGRISERPNTRPFELLRLSPDRAPSPGPCCPHPSIHADKADDGCGRHRDRARPPPSETGWTGQRPTLLAWAMTPPDVTPSDVTPPTMSRLTIAWNCGSHEGFP